MTNTLVDNVSEGYPNGSYARGAPGNAGGGSTDGNPVANDQNSGGGGGGNGGIGGQGGNSWQSNLATGGFGGSAFAPAARVTQIALGGGGGAGTRNNSSGVHSSGGTGGGMIFIRAASVTGTGTLVANGWDGLLAENDGAGGGGGGGTIFVSTMAGDLSGLIANARGGDGGDAWPTQDGTDYPGNRHGPGGGGAGGVILLSSAAGLTDVSGGANGTTTAALDPYNATPGAVGVVATIAPSAIPGVDSGAECTAELSISKTPVPSSPTAAQATYNIVVTNNGFRTATNVTVVDPLPIPPVTYVSATPSQGGPCTFASPTVTCILGSIANGASAVVTVVVNSAGGSAPSNTATVSQTETDPAGGDNSSTSGAAADLAVTLSGAPEPVAAGQVLTYTASVQNNGPNAATAAQFTLALPAMTTFNTLLEPAGWTCTTPALGAAGTVTCTRSSNMPVLALETFRIAVLVSSDAPPNTALVATAQVTSAGDTNPSNNAATTENHVTESVVLLTRAAIHGVRVDPALGLVEFATGWQRQTLAFNLYAAPSPDGPAIGQAPLNDRPIRAPRATTLTPTLYRCELPSFTATHLWIEEIESGGRQNLMGPFPVADAHSAAVLARLESAADASGTGTVALDAGCTARLLPSAAVAPPRPLSDTLLAETLTPVEEGLAATVTPSRVTPTAPAVVSTPPSTTGNTFLAGARSSFLAPQSALAAVADSSTAASDPSSVSRNGLRVEFDQPGEARLTRATLLAAGLPTDVPLTSISVSSAGEPVPTQLIDAVGQPRVLAFTVAPSSTVYTSRSVYVLKWNPALPPMRVPLTYEGDAPWNGCVRVEKSTLYVASVPLGSDPWLWDVLTSDGSTWPDYNPQLGSFTLPPLRPTADSVPVLIRLIGMSPNRHQVGASINGVSVGTIAFEGIGPALLRGTIPRSALRDGSDPSAHNDLALSYTSDAPADSPGIVYLDHLDFFVPRLLTAAPAAIVAPKRITRFYPQLPPLDTTDYMIVTHPQFAAQAQRLANLKMADGYHATVVDVERVYDTYSAGYADAAAVRALIRGVHRQAPLRYVLLFGDDTFDYHDYVGTGAVSYVPSLYGWDGEFGRVPSETLYADVDDNGTPDIAIGRLPAKTEAEAAILVDKIARQDAWRARAGRHLFVVDRDDPTPGTPSFVLESMRMAKQLGPASITWADASQGTGPARDALFGAMQQGVGFTHVFAHGAPWQWGNASLLDVDDVTGVNGAAPALPDGPETVVLTWACEAQLYTYLWGDSINEALLLRKGGGALAAFGPAGIADLAVQATLYERLYTELRTAPTLGIAIQRAKSRALKEDPRAWPAVAGWNLLGDPSLPLR